METTANTSEKSPEPPVRVLVQTLTHLVPGEDSYERIFSMLNRICQHHWNCDYNFPRFRWTTYNTKFALNNRRCFFLVDYGESQNDDDVPVLYYEWTGETLIPAPRLATDPKIQATLKEDNPFTPQAQKREKREIPIPRHIKSKLSYMDRLLPEELDYMWEHPEDMAWLKKNVRPRLWTSFVAQINASRPLDDPIMEE